MKVHFPLVPDDSGKPKLAAIVKAASRVKHNQIITNFLMAIFRCVRCRIRDFTERPLHSTNPNVTLINKPGITILRANFLT